MISDTWQRAAVDMTDLTDGRHESLVSVKEQLTGRRCLVDVELLSRPKASADSARFQAARVLAPATTILPTVWEMLADQSNGWLSVVVHQFPRADDLIDGCSVRLHVALVQDYGRHTLFPYRRMRCLGDICPSECCHDNQVQELRTTMVSDCCKA